VDEKVGNFLRWLQSRHAPLGRVAPLAASALFAVGGLAHSTLLQTLVYILASVIAILIALEIATEILGPDDAERLRRAGQPERRVPLSPFQFVLAAIQAAIYTVLIFAGLGPATPFIFIIPVFAFSSIAAWRNVRLWYREGADFEDRLHEAEVEDAEFKRLRDLQRRV